MSVPTLGVGVTAEGTAVIGVTGSTSIGVAVTGATITDIASYVTAAGIVYMAGQGSNATGPLALLDYQLSMEEAQGGAGEIIMTAPFGDPLFQAPGWVKIQHIHWLNNGQKIVIHYMKNLLTGQTAQFKFV
jgi:hypothetical protein